MLNCTINVIYCTTKNIERILYCTINKSYKVTKLQKKFKTLKKNYYFYYFYYYYYLLYFCTNNKIINFFLSFYIFVTFYMEHDNVSIQVNPAESENSVNSIPERLQTWYSHGTCRAITLSTISIVSVILTFIALFTGFIDSCESIGFITSMIMLFAPSPLSCKH